MSADPLLKIEDLRTYFYSRSRQAFIRSVNGVSLQVNRGETLGVVGESGSGKSITALSVMGLINAAPGVISGRIEFSRDGVRKNLLENLENYVRLVRQDGKLVEVRKDNVGWERNVERLLRPVRGREIAMIFQDPKLSMNPFVSIGRQISEAVRLNMPVKNRLEARERALYWLEQVRIDSPRLRYDNHPYGLSGGMCQRAMIAMALAAEPALLIADEPTTGLDATIQSKIVDLLAELKESFGITTMLISHDIEVIRRLSDRMVVMYGGTVMEDGRTAELLAGEAGGRHPYTEALLASLPSEEQIRNKDYLQAIKGDVLDTINMPAGCKFYGRCHRSNAAIEERCRCHEPELRDVAAGHKVRCWLYCE